MAKHKSGGKHGGSALDRSTLADMAQRMIAKGLLERERSAVDARANAVRLTAAGRDSLAQAQPHMAAADARLMKLVGGSGKRQALLELLRDLVEAPTGPDAKAPKAPKPDKADKAKRKAKKKAEKAPAA